MSTNHFVYDEMIDAGYLNLNKDFKGYSLQAGLRAEQSSVKGSSEDLKRATVQKPDTAYINLFPTLFLQYFINAKNQLGFNYGKRIDRPSYQDQNPFIYVLDAFNSEQGNPYLIPQITDNIEFTYTYKYANTLRIKYSITKNYIESLTYQSGNNTISTPQNSGQQKMLNINLGSSLSLSKWWNLYANAEPYYQQYETFLNGYGIQQTIQHSSWGFNSYLNNNFALAKNWKAEIGGWYNFQNTTTIYYSKAISSINIGISKKIMHEKATIKAGIADLIGTQRWEQTAQTNNLNLHTFRKWEGQNINLSFNYRFGNTKIKNVRDRKTTADEELGRIK